jgi:hypothetical protein
VPRFQFPEIVDGPQVPDPLLLLGLAIPSSFSRAAIARAECPASYSRKIRSTIVAYCGMISRSPVTGEPSALNARVTL